MKKQSKAKRKIAKAKQVVAEPKGNNEPDKWQLAIDEIQAEIQAERDGNYDHYYPRGETHIAETAFMGDPIKGVFNAFVDLHDFSSPSRKYSELYQYIKPHSPERMALSWLEYGMRMGSYFDRAIGDLGLPKPTTYEVQYKSQLTI